jgi:cell division protein ZapA (FtsZ GTPase activity inhibitor)
MNIEIILEERSYPFMISNEGEEARIRKAAARVEEKLSAFRKLYADKDLQDFLLLTALQLAVKVGDLEANNKNEK